MIVWGVEKVVRRVGPNDTYEHRELTKYLFYTQQDARNKCSELSSKEPFWDVVYLVTGLEVV